MNYKRKSNYELKEIGGETLLIPRGAETVDFNNVTVFNEAGALLLNAMNEATDVDSLAQMLVEKHGGQVPEDYDSLVALPGVGRKTANVVLSVGFGHQRIAVDTHVFRVANRLGLVKEKDVLKTELSLMERVPEERWSRTHHSLIFHGRQCCDARKPKCDECPVNTLCEYVHGEK